ncbi:MAG: metal-dependent transcriptional regulator [Methanoregulaceae archaeon]|nr:metal-dependent transcriptional regulator [Methanoregulaceae archaeon]
MDSSVREDYLEAILILLRRGRSPTPVDIAGELMADPAAVEDILSALVTEGYITRGSDGRISLTNVGQDLAGTVERKHRVLQRFFMDILGMEHRAASDEACQVEHAVSDDAIERLRHLIRSGGECDIPAPVCTGRIRALPEYGEDEPLVVCAIIGHDGYERLSDLGIVPGATIMIKRKIGDGAILVRVKECDIALSPDIAGLIRAERAPTA